MPLPSHFVAFSVQVLLIADRLSKNGNASSCGYYPQLLCLRLKITIFKRNFGGLPLKTGGLLCIPSLDL